MDTNPPFAAPADYLGLKEELQKIAGIIEQYPDQLKQRAFDLLINAYLARTGAVASPAAAAVPETQAEVSVPADEVSGETVANEASVVAEEQPAEEAAPTEILTTDADMGVDENGYAIRNGNSALTELEPDSRITANLENSTNMLRRRIRLRTMSQMPWHQSS